jgi:hypothetical protein
MVTAGATLIRRTHRTDGHGSRLGEFGSHREAERMVDQLFDAGFPIERIHIVGVGPRGVEKVTERRTKIRAMLLGAGLGGWLGMLTGLVLALSVAGPAWGSVLLGGLLIGAFLGGLVGVLTHWATDGRDFAGAIARRTRRYAVEVDRPVRRSPARCSIGTDRDGTGARAGPTRRSTPVPLDEMLTQEG